MDMNKKSFMKETKTEGELLLVEITEDDMLIWLLAVCNERDIPCKISSENTVDMQVENNTFRVQFTLLK